MKEKREKEKEIEWEYRSGSGGGGETSGCAVVSKKEVEKRTATGERAANKLPGRSQRQVKQRRRG